MKTAIIISDTHGNMRDTEKLFDIFSEADYIIHLGDTSVDGAKIRSRFPRKTVVLNGNCDPISLGENEAVITIENLRIYATHGHLFSAKSGRTKLAEKAKSLNCPLALYGHTHKAMEEEINGVFCVNPGTFSRYSQHSYCYLVVNGEKFVTKIVYV